MAMTVYLDESGTHGAEARVMTIAGFIATAEQWDAYEDALKSLFDEFGIKKFHAKDFRQSKGDFKGWQVSKKAQFNSRFLQLADSHLSAGVAAVLEAARYANVYRASEFPKRSRPDTPYGLCLRILLYKFILFMADRPLEQPLDIIMEAGHRNSGDAIRIFSDFKNDWPGEFGCLRFGSKKNCLPFAAADSLAYAMFRKKSGLSSHPSVDDAAPVGPADPPYYVHKIPMSHIAVEDKTLIHLRNKLMSSYAAR